MLLLYKLLTFFFYTFLIIIIYIRKFLRKEDDKRYIEKIFLSKLPKIKKNKLIWFHAASIGEVQSIIPLIKKINENNENISFLITSVTLTSGKLIEEKFKNISNLEHRYFPLDVSFLVKNFLDFWRPDIILFVDSEIWPNFLIEIKKKGTPLILLNGRITKKTFIKWNIILKTAQKIFQNFDLCLVSNNETFNYLKKFKAKNIKFIGNLKFATEHKIDSPVTNKNNILNTKKFWCAVSTHEGEDVFCLKVHSNLKLKQKNLITIIIPRHINRAKSIGDLCKKLNLKYRILSKNDEIENEDEVIIVNSYGVVTNYLKLCKSVFIGKSIIRKLKPTGGQNPIEAAKLGCKIYHGPYIYNFQEIYKLLNEYKIAEEIRDIKELSNKLDFDFNNLKNINEKKINDINYLGKEILDNSYSEIKRFFN